MSEQHSLPFLRETLLFLTLAGVLIPLLQRLKVNQVLGFLGVGLVVGPYGLGLWVDTWPWLARELGSDVPLHFSAFHPDWKMNDLPPTPPATLARARRIARDAGLHYVYCGNVHDEEGGTTYCPSCHHAIIVRDWYDIRHYDLSVRGCCPDCGTSIAGRFGAFGKPFGRTRVAVHLAS